MFAAKVIHRGFLTTVQDLGRFGYRHLGVPVSGAADCWALITANRLVGNEPGAACLEMTLAGPGLLFSKDCIVAMTGADMSPRIFGRKAPMWESFLCSAGDLLSFGYRRKGCRTYLAFAGGIDTAPVMGSRSTFLTGGFGGHGGRLLAKGDCLPVRNGPEIEKLSLENMLGKRYPVNRRPVYAGRITVRAVPGIDRGLFSELVYRKLFDTEYMVTGQSDRMGCRLEGNNLVVSRTEALTESFPVTPGSIQVLPTGKPVILMHDAQSTGGYPQIGCIIAADLWKVAQAVPGDAIKFLETDVPTALKILNDKYKEAEVMDRAPQTEFYQNTGENRYKVTIKVQNLCYNK
ncbi:biotin-dependent carboxyltransferase family protein [Phosphitispora fastidiosa]|uniref:5-oxoprolinase subunit C family protein n=1 Tax=Phosphitispora fastidiosa TaxID=2837202 RepID=UPI001E4310AC|nr:biotin-dependent carboxyltransferase family protein [Phosphitispora fastidiosa]MBU7005412.1 antagonist of KipI [Phosphitispora fastidiosa]